MLGLYPRDAALELGGGETPRQPASRASSDIGGQDVIQSVGWISEEEVVGAAFEGLADASLAESSRLLSSSLRAKAGPADAEASTALGLRGGSAPELGDLGLRQHLRQLDRALVADVVAREPAEQEVWCQLC